MIYYLNWPLDAQWVPRSAITKLLGNPSSSKYSDADVKKLEKISSSHRTLSDQETANALAPSERKEEAGEGGKNEGLTRVPPETAIAGQLIRLWASGGVELVSQL